MKKFVIYANCQVNGLGKTLLENQHFREQYAWDFLEPVQCLSAENADAAAQKISQADLLLYQPIKQTDERPKELSSDYLLGKVKKGALCLSFPSIYFDGYYPHLSTMNGAQGVLNLAHDYIIAYCALQKKSVSDTLRLIASPALYPKDLSVALCEQSLQELENREHAHHIDIRLSPFIRAHFRQERLFNQFNHPRRPLYTYLVNAVCDAIGCEPCRVNYETEYQDKIKTPVYRSTYANLGLTFTENFWLYNALAGRNVPQDRIVADCLACYAQLDQTWLRDRIRENKPFVPDLVDGWQG